MNEIDMTDDRCEEASMYSHNQYVPCLAPAVAVIQHIGRNEGPYRMCFPCAYHNVYNRQAKVIAVAKGNPDSNRLLTVIDPDGMPIRSTRQL